MDKVIEYGSCKIYILSFNLFFSIRFLLEITAFTVYTFFLYELKVIFIQFISELSMTADIQYQSIYK